MKTLKHLAALSLLILTLTVSARAGEMQGPIAPPPPPPPPPEESSLVGDLPTPGFAIAIFDLFSALM